MQSKPRAECQETFLRLGLREPNALAAPDGFEVRILEALAHLREAWTIADDTNAIAVVRSIAALLPRCDHRGLALAVLVETLYPEVGERLIAAVGIEVGRGE